MGWRELLGVADDVRAPTGTESGVGPVQHEAVLVAEPDAAPDGPDDAGTVGTRARRTISTEPTQPAPNGGSVPCVGFVRANPDADAHGVAARDPARWLAFKALCLGRGARPDELARHFPSIADREDIACSADGALEALAEHLAAVILAEREAAAVRAPWGVVDGAEPDADDWRIRRVTCGACAHLERVAGHPHTGHCAVQSPEVSSAVLWDTDPRTCSLYAEAT